MVENLLWIGGNMSSKCVFCILNFNILQTSMSMNLRHVTHLIRKYHLYIFLLNLTLIFNYSTLNKDGCFSRVIIFVVRLGQTRLLSFRAILFCVCRRVPNIAQTRKFIYQITHSRVHLVQCYVFDCFARRFELKMLMK